MKKIRLVSASQIMFFALCLCVSVVKSYGDDLYDKSGGGAFVCNNGTLSSCIIRDCGAEVDGGGAVCFSGSRIQNCLIYNNETVGKGGGVYSVDGGDVYNCTISSNSANSGGGIFREVETNGCIFNSIIYFNNADSDVNYHTTNNVEYSCVYPLAAGEGNISDEPGFKKYNPLAPFVKGEFELIANSPCIGSGKNDYAVNSYDLIGNLRIYNSIVDMGAYEAMYGSRVPEISILTTNATVKYGVDEYLIEGSNNTEVFYITLKNSSENYNVTVSKSQYWSKNIALNAGTNEIFVYGKNLENVEVSDSVTIIREPPVKFYVSPDGQHLPPFNNWDRAANDIQSAIDISARMDEIIVAPDTYVLNSEIIVDDSQTIMPSNDLYSVIIDGNGLSRCFTISEEATLYGLVISNGFDTHGGGVLCDGGGTISNCIVTSCAVNDSGGGGVFCESGGNIAQSIIENNTAFDTDGGGVYFSITGNMSYCTVENNEAKDNGGGADNNGGGVYITGDNVKVFDSIIQENNCNPGNGGGFYCDGGSLVDRCVVEGNKVFGIGKVGGGVFGIGGALVRNNLIYRNEAAGDGGGAYLTGAAEMWNNTIVYNKLMTSGSSGGVKCLSTNELLNNCIVYYNSNNVSESNLDGGKYSYCCSPDLEIENGNIINAPNFEKASAIDGNFILNAVSDCIDSGTNTSQAGTLDILSNSRKINYDIDIGAYERKVVKYYVNSKLGANTSTNGTFQYPYETIQYAIDRAVEKGGNAQILLQGGIYKESIIINHTNKMSLHIVSMEGFNKRGKRKIKIQRFQTVLNTIIDPPPYHRAFYIESSDVIIEGITFRGGGGGLLHDGGAIYCKGANANTEIRRCFFKRNRANYKGGAIYINNASPRITSCIFANNRSKENSGVGGAIGVYRAVGNIQIAHCTFVKNFAKTVGRGGAIYIFNSSANFEIANNIFYKNSTQNRNLDPYNIHIYKDLSPNVTVVNNFMSPYPQYSSDGQNPKLLGKNKFHLLFKYRWYGDKISPCRNDGLATLSMGNVSKDIDGDNIPDEGAADVGADELVILTDEDTGKRYSRSFYYETLAAQAEVEGDDIPEDEEEEIEFDILADTDNDGVINIDEFLGASDMGDASSRPDPVAEWRFDGSLIDNSGWGQDLFSQNAPDFEAGQIGRAANFNGTSSTYVDGTNLHLLGFSRGFAIMSWIKWEKSIGAQTIIEKSNNYSLEVLRSGALQVTIDGTIFKTATNIIEEGIWTHIAVAAESDAFIEIYVNGEILVNTDAIETFPTDDSKVFVGSNSSSGNKWENGIDEMIIYNWAIFPEDIRNWYAKGLTVAFRENFEADELNTEMWSFYEGSANPADWYSANGEFWGELEYEGASYAVFEPNISNYYVATYRCMFEEIIVKVWDFILQTENIYVFLVIGMCFIHD